MSVVFKNEKGWLLDACSLVDQGCARCILEGKAARKWFFKCCFKQQYFRILKSHFSVKPSDAGTKVCAITDTVKCTSCVPSKKRKRKSNLNSGEIESMAYHDKVRSAIVEGSRSLVDAGLSCGHLTEEDQPQGSPPSQECNLAALCDMAKQLPLLAATEENPVQLIDAVGGSTEHLDLFTRITKNCMNCAVEMTLMGEKYIIPPQCSFLLSDFTRMQPLVDCGRKYELIVLDPPWENKSVKRSGRYNFLPSSQLKRLPVPLLASPGCMVVTWVTNRPSHLRFVRDELYPHWGVDVLAEWLWVKVTRSGEFVFPLDSQHKRPYEVLVLGRFPGSTADSPGSLGKSETTVEDQRVIVSVPSLLHSQKPSLSEVLKPYVGADASCLELFARSLQPGWTSWGNEVLKFQQVSYFTMEPTEEPIEKPAEDPPTEPPDTATQRHTDPSPEGPTAHSQKKRECGGCEDS